MVFSLWGELRGKNCQVEWFYFTQGSIKIKKYVALPDREINKLRGNAISSGDFFLCGTHYEIM